MTTENSSLESASSGASSSDSGSQSHESTSSHTESTTPSVSTPDAATSGSVASPSLDANGNPVASVAPAYQPNFKFKAFGKEHEIEETFRGLIKDKETEEKIRKFHEKAYAMEQFKADKEVTKKEFDSFRQQAEPNLKAMTHFNNLLKNKDWDNFFGGLKVPEDEIFNWVQKRLELRGMPPEQRAEFDRQNQIRQQNYAYENEIQETKANYQRLAAETRTMQLDNMLVRPEVLSQAERLDQAYGQPGAFRGLVIEEAVNHYNRTGEDVPADQAVQMTLQKYGRLLQTQNQGAATSPQAPGQASAPQGTQAGPAPIIPHVGGSARAPVRKAPRSLDDLKAMAKNS